MRPQTQSAQLATHKQGPLPFAWHLDQASLQRPSFARWLRRAKAGHFDRLATELQAFLLPSAGEKPKAAKGAGASRQEQFAARRATAAAAGAKAGAKDGAAAALAGTSAPAFGSTAKTKDSLKSTLQKEWTSILRKVELEQPIAKAKSKSKKRPPPPADGTNRAAKKGSGRAQKQTKKTKGLVGGGGGGGGSSGVNRGRAPVAPKGARPPKRLKSSPVDGTLRMDGLREGEEDLEGVDPESMPSPASQTVLRLLAAAAIEGASTAQESDQSADQHQQVKSNDPDDDVESGPGGQREPAPTNQGQGQGHTYGAVTDDT